jgi:hypothetical protein
VRLVFVLLVITAACATAQQESSAAPGPPITAPALSSSTNLPDAPSYIARRTLTNPSEPQPERGFSLFPNSRAASPEAISAPPTSRESQNPAAPSPGYSSLMFSGGAPTDEESSDAHRRFNAGVHTSENNCPHASADKADGSNWINSLLSVTSHARGSYCALGEGGFWKRSTYAARRAMVAHKYNGINSFKNSQISAADVVPSFPTSTYSYQYYTGARVASGYASAVGRDALRNMFSEFWPDISTHLFHRRP